MAQSVWWKSLSPTAKASYIKAHPNSQYAKGAKKVTKKPQMRNRKRVYTGKPSLGKKMPPRTRTTGLSDSDKKKAKIAEVKNAISLLKTKLASAKKAGRSTAAINKQIKAKERRILDIRGFKR